LEALASDRRPEEAAELRRWVMGIARHKVADFHRRGRKEVPEELPEVEVSPAPHEAREMVRWAEQQAHSTRDAGETLKWMAREGEGEKLETIAEEEALPPARVRQRVSRMRRWMRERWLAELAAVAALGVLLVVAWRWAQPRAGDEAPTADVLVAPPAPVERAMAMRREAFGLCDEGAFQACLDRLDQAKGLDPAGDAVSEVGAARARARVALDGPPEPEPKATTTASPEVTPPEVAPTAPPKVAPPTKQPPTKQPPRKPRSTDLKQQFEEQQNKKNAVPKKEALPQQQKAPQQQMAPDPKRK